MEVTRYHYSIHLLPISLNMVCMNVLMSFRHIINNLVIYLSMLYTVLVLSGGMEANEEALYKEIAKVCGVVSLDVSAGIVLAGSNAHESIAALKEPLVKAIKNVPVENRSGCKLLLLKSLKKER
jgi:hypothetical protein